MTVLRKLLFIYSYFLTISVYAQFDALNTSLIGRYEYPNKILNDVWGYVDEEQNEYALVGIQTGFSIIDVTGDTYEEVFWVEGNQTVWRDVKTYGDYAYVCNDNGNQGILIVDMGNLPASNDLRYKYIGDSSMTAHNLYIDENYLYIFGHNFSNQGVLIYDLSDPWNPDSIGMVDIRYCHDGFARNDTLWTSDINEGYLSIIDISDKSNPILLGEVLTPDRFAHNCWPSDDGQYVFVTEERSGSPITSYDISNIENIQELDQYFSSVSEDVIPHNTHYLNGYLYTSHYRDGLTIVDASRPSSLVEVGYFDSAPELEGDGFDGAWGVYPYLPSGKMLITDMQNGLFVVEANPERGSFYHLHFIDSTNGRSIPAVSILQNGKLIKQSDLGGDLFIGFNEEGTYDIELFNYKYEGTSIQIDLERDTVKFDTVYLNPRPSFEMRGIVKDENDHGISKVMVTFRNEFVEEEVLTDNEGNFSLDIIEGDYTFILSKWGYVSQYDSLYIIEESDTNIEQILQKGYYDDFDTDLGWTIEGNASRGMFERAMPIPIYFNGIGGNQETTTPELDATDNSRYCFITENGETDQIGENDVDDGYTSIFSPWFVYDQNAVKQVVELSYWFRNFAGDGRPNDSLNIFLVNNDLERISLDIITDNTDGWESKSYNLTDIELVQDSFRLLIVVRDGEPGHVLEVGIDAFRLSDTVINHVNELGVSFELYPNPTNNIIYIKGLKNYESTYIVYDVQGRVVKKGTFQSNLINMKALDKGLYFLRIGEHVEIINKL